ncbi:MAG: glutathione S-transferase family protein [Alphaproteobacteria bacterium]|nr:glutathione S-transferase family protein [Alphaproteobacteria bacterium]
MGNPVLAIGDKRYSSWSLRPWLALRMAGVAFDEYPIRLRQPDTRERILAFSPSGKVPALRLPDGTIMWDSLAICEWAAEQDGSLLPNHPSTRAICRSVSAEMHAGFPRLRQEMSMDLLRDEALPEIPEDVAAEIARIQAIWSDCRARFGQDGPFLFGRFTIADAMWAPVATRFTSYRVPLAPVPAAYVEALWALPDMLAWKADASRE